jgi:hypothetical protein
MADMDKTIEKAWHHDVLAAILPANRRFDESWEQLPGETGRAYTAFCAYRDLGPERNIRKVVETAENDTVKREKKYRIFSDAA